MMKPGDRVWHHERQESITVAVVDVDAKAFASDRDVEEWFAIDAAGVQTEGTRDELRAALLAAAKREGKRGEIARAAIAREWSEGTWAQ